MRSRRWIQAAFSCGGELHRARAAGGHGDYPLLLVKMSSSPPPCHSRPHRRRPPGREPVRDLAAAPDPRRAPPDEGDGVDADIVTYNTLIYGLARAGMVAKARTFLHTMAAEGLVPEVITYTSLMNGMCVKDDALGALELLQEMEAKGCQPNEWTYNTLLMGPCKNKKLDKAVEVYSSMAAAGMKLEVYVEVYTSMAAAGMGGDERRAVMDREMSCTL